MIRLAAPCTRLIGILIVATPAASAQLLVAHRGASSDAPENTLAAFRLAWEQDADAIEADFRLSRDGKIVCMHDPTTGRTCDANLQVKEASLAELRRLDAGSFMGERFRGERIPTLEEVLKTVPEHGRIFIEVKCGPEILPALRKDLARSKLSRDQIAVISFNRGVIKEARRRLRSIAAYWLTSYEKDKETGQWRPTPDEVMATLEEIRATGLNTHANVDVVGKEVVEQLRRENLEFHCWTVNDVSRAMRFRALGVDSITTDRPRWLRDRLPSAGLREHLQVHLPLDGDLKDTSGSSLHGEWIAESGGHAYTRGVFGSALRLNESKNAVCVPIRLPEEGSISLWVRPAPW